MNKKIISFIVILVILTGALLVLTGCGENNVDISKLSFDPKGVWVYLSTGEPAFELFANGTLDCGDDELQTWSVVDEDVINVSLGELGDYKINLVQYLGYKLVGNENVIFCLESDFENAYNDVYIPSIAEYEDYSDEGVFTEEYDDEIPEDEDMPE